MESLQELQTTSTLKSYKVTKAKTVADLLQELKLESKFFAILANGKKVKLTDKVEPGTELTILPKIAGGY